MQRVIQGRWLVVVVALLTMVGPFTIDAYFPSFPTIEGEFGVGRAALSQTLAWYMAAFAVATLWWGPLSDRFGRRITILLCMGVYSLASVGCALAEDYSQFLAWRVLQGLGAAGGLVAGRAMLRDAYDSREAQRAMAQVMMVFAIAPAVAPVMGGWMHEWFGWRSVFWFLSAYAVLMWLLVRFWVTETLALEARRTIHPVRVVKRYAGMLVKARFLALVFCISFSFGGLFLFIAGSPTVMFDFLGRDSTSFGLQFVPMVAGLMSGSWVSARLAHRCSRSALVGGALALQLIASCAAFVSELFAPASLVGVVAPLMAYAFGVALLVPVITVLALDCFEEHRGTASAVQAFVQMLVNAAIAGVLAPLLAASLQQFNLGRLVMCGLAILLWLCCARESRKT